MSNERGRFLLNIRCDMTACAVVPSDAVDEWSARELRVRDPLQTMQTLVDHSATSVWARCPRIAVPAATAVGVRTAPVAAPGSRGRAVAGRRSAGRCVQRPHIGYALAFLAGRWLAFSECARWSASGVLEQPDGGPCTPQTPGQEAAFELLLHFVHIVLRVRAMRC